MSGCVCVPFNGWVSVSYGSVYQWPSTDALIYIENWEHREGINFQTIFQLKSTTLTKPKTAHPTQPVMLPVLGIHPKGDHVLPTQRFTHCHGSMLPKKNPILGIKFYRSRECFLKDMCFTTGWNLLRKPTNIVRPSRKRFLLLEGGSST